MKKFYFINLAIITIFCNACKAQKSCNLHVSFERFNISFIPVLGERIVKMQLDEFVKLKCKSCIGDAIFQHYLNDTILICSGEYFGIKDTIYDDVVITDFVTLKTTNLKQPCFKPLRDKKWDYYNTKMQLIKSEIWDKGLLIESHLYWELQDSINNIIVYSDPITEEVRKSRLPYLEVVKQGNLIFYDEKKNIIKIEKWNNGVLIK